MIGDLGWSRKDWEWRGSPCASVPCPAATAPPLPGPFPMSLSLLLPYQKEHGLLFKISVSH